MDFKTIVEAEGCQYIETKDGIVYFRDPQNGGLRLSLYVFACDAECVKLTLKNTRGPVEDFPPLEATEKVP